MVVVDERGNIIYGDMLMVIFARVILKEIPGATFMCHALQTVQPC